MPELAGMADNFRNFWQALAHLRDLYAPNVVLGQDLSIWGPGADLTISLRNDPNFNWQAHADRLATYHNSFGPGYALNFFSPLDRDAAYYELVQGSNRWWHDSSQQPSFDTIAAWLGRIDSATNKRALMWQVPNGNQQYRSENNTDGHYQDNRPEYFLNASTGRSHMSLWANYGVIGVMFGAGVGSQSHYFDSKGDGITNPPPINGNNLVATVADDDGGYIRANAAAYYSGGTLPLPGGTPGTPVPTSTSAPATATRTSTAVATSTRTATRTSTPGASTTPANSATATRTATRTATSAPTATPASGVSSTVYDDVLQNGWQNWSWRSNINFASTAYVHAGSRSTSVQFTGSWAGLQLGSSGFNTTGYDRLTFWVNGGSSSGQQMEVYVADANGNYLTSRPLDSYISGGSIGQNSWRQVSIPLSDLGATSRVITAIVLQDTTGGPQPTFYLDDVLFAGGQAATATTAATATRTNTSVPATATRTSAPPTNTPANTATRTPTSPVSTATRTSTRTPTGAIPTATRTSTRTATSAAPTATRTPTLTDTPVNTPTRTNTVAAATPTSQAGGALPWLKTQGGRVVRADNSSPVELRGVNLLRNEWVYPSMSFEEQAVPQLANVWHSNLIVHGFASGPVVAGDATYLSVLDEYQQLAEQNGMYIIYCYYYPSINGDQPPTASVDPNAQQALVDLVQRYKNKSNVLFMLQAEPHSGDWNGTYYSVSWATLRPVYDQMVSAMRAVDNPSPQKHLILASGSNWGRDISGAVSNPITADGGQNIVYSSHPYDPPSEWSYFLSVADAGYPVMVTEFGTGSQMSQSDTETLMNTMNSGGRHIGWTAWLFDNEGCPCLLTGDRMDFTPSNPYGISVRDRIISEATRFGGGGPAPSPTPTNQGATATPTHMSGGSPTVTPTRTATRTSVPATSTPTSVAGTHSTVYDDALDNGWQNWSWRSNINFASTAYVHAGSRSTSVQFTGSWAGLQLGSSGFNTTGYDRLTFWVNGGSSSGQQMEVYVADANGNYLTSRPLDSYISGGSIGQNSWRQVSIPLSDLGATSRVITAIVLQDTTGGPQPTFYLDDVLFAGGS